MSRRERNLSKTHLCDKWKWVEKNKIDSLIEEEVGVKRKNVDAQFELESKNVLSINLSEVG